MRAVCVLNGSVSDFVLNEMAKIPKMDFLIFKYGICGSVKFGGDDELECDDLYDIMLLSVNLDCVILAGCDSIFNGKKYKSCIVVDRGKMLGIADCNSISKNEDYTAGFGYKVYDSRDFAFGVVLSNDIVQATPSHIISHALGEYMFCILDESMESEKKDYCKASCLMGGIDGLFVFDDDAFACDCKAGTNFGAGTNVKIFEIKKTAKFSTVEKRLRR